MTEVAQQPGAQAPKDAVPSFEDDPQQVDTALARLRKCFKTHKTKAYNYRVLQLKQLHKGLRTMSNELSVALTKDLSKSDFTNWIYEIRLCEREIEHALANLKDWMKDEVVDTPLFLGPGRSYIQKEPLGVVAVLGSWNFPVATTIGPVISAMAAGNCVLIKPSEFTPWTAKAMKTLFARFMDLNAYQLVTGAVNVAIRVTNSPVDLIFFTGSTQKGKLVAQAAAKNLIPCILELGGKCPMIVDESADLQYAAKKAAFSGFINSGQLCVRCDYALVHNNQADKFLTLLKKELETQYQWGQDKRILGKVINDFHHERCCQLMADHGGTVIVGNANADIDKHLLPTVILNPSLDSDVMKEEIFGPIMPVFTYKNIGEAIDFINEMDKPLGVYYFGKNSWRNKNLMQVKNETSSGGFLINDIATHFMSEYTSFGGVGQSGYGRCHGKEGFIQCSNSKAILAKTPLNFWPFTVVHPPLTEHKVSMMRHFVTTFDYSQSQVFKRMFWLAVIIFLLWLILTKRLTLKKIRMYKAMIKMAWQMRNQ